MTGTREIPEWRRVAGMFPQMFRTGLASVFAYRAEFLVWVLTTNMPLVNLALWSAISSEAPVKGWGQKDFIAYFLITLAVRLMTGCWVLWELNMEIRQGTLALRLLRPIHPLLAHATENLAAMPMRAVIVVPIALLTAFFAGPDALSHDPVAWLAAPLMVVLAWVMTFLVMAAIGALALLLESTAGLFEVWLGLFTVFSGYLVPLDLFPPWARAIGDVLPFRLLLALPVETMLGRVDHAGIATGLGLQLAWCTAFFVALRFTWNTGMKRYQAFGG